MKVYGVDNSMYGKKKYPHLEIQNVDLLKNSLPYPDNTFDVIYSIYSCEVYEANA